MIRQGFVQSDQFLKDLVKFNIYPENPNAIQELNSMLLDLGIPKSTNPLAPKNIILHNDLIVQVPGLKSLAKAT